MILVLDLAYRPCSLSADEFVAPVERVIRGEGFTTRVRHYTGVTPEDTAASEGAVLCGTALADFGYLDRPGAFAWVSSSTLPILGICAGMQVIAKLFGGDVAPGVGIGMAGQAVVAPDPLLAGMERFEAYELHGLAVVPPPFFRVLASSQGRPSVIRHPDRAVYGVLFHPEVRNEWLIRRFLALCRPGGRERDTLKEEHAETSPEERTG